MDFEDIVHTIDATALIPSPANVEHFEALFREELEQFATKLPLDVWCKGGYYETGSLTVEELTILHSTPDSIKGCAIVEFTEYDPSHFSDGLRMVRLDFAFEWETGMLVFRCRDTALELED